MSELFGTKERIFDAFIEMSSTLGYENVTTREIAKKVGINAASIYHHYKSKDMILEHVYEYYMRHYYDNRIPIETMMKRLESESAEELIFALARNFASDDQKQHMRMILITKLIYMRLFQDAAANEMFNENNDNETKYLTSILTHGVEVGRIRPDFDKEAFASILLGSMVAMGVMAFASPAYTVGLLDHESRMRSMLATLFESGLVQRSPDAQASE